MLQYLDQHNVQPTNDEEKDLRILHSVLNKYIAGNYGYNHPASLNSASATRLNYKTIIKAPENVLCYKCRMYLPKDIEDSHFIPEPSYAPRNDMEVEMLSQADPGNQLYEMVRKHCYPDPPNFHIARFKDWFKDLDPGQFQEGAIKETIKERWSYFMQDRDRIIKNYCKENHLSKSSFPLPILTKIKEPRFAHFGPQNTWIDNIDRWLRQADVPIALVSEVLSSS